MTASLFVRMAAITAVSGVASSTASASIAIPTVAIGNPGNAADPATGFGSVRYGYNIGQTEVTNAQYAAFLNAKAASDPNGMYNTNMAGFFGGIARSGADGSYTYSTIEGRANNPVNFVSFWDATRFANWLHNDQGNGDTETGAYTLTTGGVASNTITRNAGWRWAVTRENEWYKAAYHQPASAGGLANDYWPYPTASYAINPSQANCEHVIGNTTPVGTYEANYYGTFDMGGNVWEWNEAIISGSYRGFRGGSYNFDRHSLWAFRRDANYSDLEVSFVGFRVSQIPGPSSVALLVLGGLMTVRRRAS